MKNPGKAAAILLLMLAISHGLNATAPGPRRHRRAENPKCLRMLHHVLGDQAECRLYEVDGRRFAIVERKKKRYAALFTADYSQIEGYRGVTNCLVLLDLTGAVADVQVLESEDTPPYVQRVIREGFLGQFQGLKPGERPEVDAVTGATFTCEAIRDSLFAALDAFPRIAEAVDFSGPEPRRKTDGGTLPPLD